MLVNSHSSNKDAISNNLTRKLSDKSHIYQYYYSCISLLFTARIIFIILGKLGQMTLSISHTYNWWGYVIGFVLSTAINTSLCRLVWHIHVTTFRPGNSWLYH
jgi:hypothetical protein